jgi:hypothetical protein
MAKYQYFDGTFKDGPALIVSVNGVDHEALLVFYTGNVDFFWGPKESGFAVIRSKGEYGTSFMALDLKRGKCLGDD